jgi:hypothetical protein
MYNYCGANLMVLTQDSKKNKLYINIEWRHIVYW